MSDRGRSTEGGGRGLDAAIDRAVREMLDVEPPPGLRGRVLDRIEHADPVASAFSPHGLVASAFRRKGGWIGVPIAAAAVIFIVVLVPWRNAAPPAPTPAGPAIAQRETPRVARPVVAPPVAPLVAGPATQKPRAPQAPPVASTNAAHVTAGPPQRLIQAAAAPAEDMNFTAIEALAGPESLAIEHLRDPLPSSMRSIEPAALQIRALEITALPEAPRERREE